MISLCLSLHSSAASVTQVLTAGPDHLHTGQKQAQLNSCGLLGLFFVLSTEPCHDCHKVVEVL